MSDFPSTPDSHLAATLDSAVAHRQAGRLDPALELCRRVLESDPDHPVALHLTGVLWLQLGQAKKAIPPLQRLLDQDPGAIGALLPLGTA
ncbi:MAG: tetratricopeptide repeat protein, partial [Acidobacteriota bacterium]